MATLTKSTRIRKLFSRRQDRAPSFTELLRTDFDGRPVDDLDDVIDASLEDSRAQARVPGLIALMSDPSAQEDHRMWACVALTTWAEPAGFAAVIAAASDPAHLAWAGASIDRLFAADDTFGQFTSATRDARYMSVEKGTEPLRVDALLALIGVADQWYLGGQIESAIASARSPVIVEPVTEVVQRGLGRLAANEHAAFDLQTQLISMLAPMARHEPERAVDLTRQLLAIDPGGRAMRYAVTVAAIAQGPAGTNLGEYLWNIGNDTTREALARNGLGSP